MNDLILPFARTISNAIEIIMVLVVVAGCLVTLVSLTLSIMKGLRLPEHIRVIWLSFAAWILLGLEFALAADLIDTVASPSWEEIGRFGAIAAIRIALGYFLGRDIGEYSKDQPNLTP